MGAEYTKVLRVRRWTPYLIHIMALIALTISSAGLYGQQAVQVIWPLTNDAESIYTSGIGHTSFNYGTALTGFRYDSVNGATSGGWDSRTLNKNAYFEYTLTPEKDAEITLTQLKFEVSLSSVNMRTAVHYSRDGFSKENNPIGNTVYVGKRSSRDLLVETSIRVQYPQTLSIRIYGWSAPNPAINFFTRNVEFEGVVSTEKEPSEPVIADTSQTEGERSVLATFIVPADVYSLTVECWGGGGGGGAGAPAGGGGGGAYAKATFPVTPSTSYTYNIGGGGITGGPGGNSNFISPLGTTLVMATGGSGASNGTGGAGGAAGSSIGDIVFSGGNGGNSGALSGGGGGGSATATGNGGNGAPGSGSTGGLGGIGEGNGGNGGNNLSSGNLGIIPGGGGGGAGAGSTSRAGAPGRVTITYCVSPTITLSLPYPTACSGATTASLAYSAVTQSPDQYRIDFDATAEGQGFVDVGWSALPLPAPNTIIITVPAGGNPGAYSAQIYVQNTTTGCVSQPVSFTVTIKALPVATVTNNTPVICSGSATNITATSTLPSTYTWTMTPVNVNGNLSGSGIPINQTLTTQTPAQGTATYYITPRSAGCDGLPVSTVVTVNPIPDVIITPSPQTICSGQSTGLALTSSVSGTTFTWTVSQTNVTGGSAGSGTSIDQVLTCSPTNVTGTATYTVTGSAAGCSSTKTVTVTVKPVPTVSAVPISQNACPDKAITPINISNPNGVPGTIFSWVRSDVPELSGIPLNGSANPITGTFSSTTPTIPLTTIFTITASLNGCSSNTTASVTVGDNTAPIVTCPVSGPQNVTTNFNCAYVHTGNTWNATASDNCDVASITYMLTGATVSAIPGTTLNNVAFNLGITTVTWTATDHSGNTSTCSFNVSVTDDDNPSISCPGNQSATTNNLCTYVHSGTTWDATATDNCTVSPAMTWVLTGITTGSGNTTLNGIAFNRGVTTVTWTATDGAGRTATCSYTVTVTDDDPPVISCPGNQTVTTNSGCQYLNTGTGWNATATDNCSVSSITYVLTGATTGTGTTLNNIVFNTGITTVTWTAIDVQGNTVQCSYTITVSDVTGPTINCPANVIDYANGTTCSKKISIAQPTFNDNCPVASLTWVMTGATNASSPATGINYIPNNYEFNVGLTTVTYIVKDQAGNPASCSFTVSVIDNRNPDIICPVPAASYPNTPGQCYAALTFAATATDNCDPNPIIRYYVGGVQIVFPYNFPVGTTTVTAIATDYYNNSGPCTFNVVVIDTEKPTITCVPSPQNRPTDPGVCTYTAVGTEFDPTATSDNCGVLSVINNKTNTSTLAGAIFSNTSTVTWTVRDINGNTQTCQVTVVVTDNQPPVFTNCPTDVTVYTGPGRSTCDQVATWTPPTATDNCAGGVPVTPNYLPGSTFPVGTTTVIYTAGTAPNISTCSFNVIVIDNTPPTFTITPAVSTVYVDASCNASTLPGITGDVTDEFDNCTPVGLNATYSDSPIVPGACTGEYSFTRTWRLTDIHGNSATPATQTIYVEDNTPPALTVPPPITVGCEDGVLPAVTGQATATDNCGGTVTIPIPSDIFVPDPFCPSGGVLTRTWTAIDCAGNTSTGTQVITITDTEPPTGSAPNFSVACPDDIPDPNPAIVVANDNCGVDHVEFDHEQATFPSTTSGYCPLYVDRYYKIFDQCGLYTIISHRITVLGTCGCQKCEGDVPQYTIDLIGQPTGSITLSDVVRKGLCCTASWPMRCVSFNIRLDPMAVGIQITFSSGATPDIKEWKMDCQPINLVNGNIICIPGGDYHLFTYCKQGGNDNWITFTSLAGVLIVDDVNARIGCSSQITTNVTSAVTWNSISPGNPGDYNSYLSCTNCPNPIFTPLVGSPPSIEYEVCGGVTNSPCVGTGGYGCDVLTVTVYPPISVVIQPDPMSYCNPAIPTFTAVVTPAGTFYTIEWYNAPGATGTLVGTGTTYHPTSPGLYSIKVTDTRPGIPCSTYIYDFEVAPDDQPPVVNPPANLVLECNDPGNNAAIQAWLLSATAVDDHTQNPVITNNYTGLNIGCGAVTTVTWTAVDQCNNPGTASATITLQDTKVPVWVPGNIDRTLACSDAAGITAAQALRPQATDQCDNSLTITKTAGPFVAGACPQSGTYTNTFIASDDCGNQSVVFTQIITVNDNIAPVWVDAPGSLNVSIECSDPTALAAAQAMMPVATDNCDPTIVAVKTAGIFVPDISCATAGTYTNTFTATDDCGNAGPVFTQIITITDNSDPAITTPASDMTVECDGSGNTAQLNAWIASHGGAVASDACGGITWSNTNPVFSDLCGLTGRAQVTFTATDVCGNSVTTSASFIIRDLTPPVITCPADVIANVDPATCEATGVNLGTATASDLCSDPVNIENDAPAAFPGGVTTIVTWTATDACGNISTCQQNVTVIDPIPPTVECPDNVTVDADAGFCSANVVVPSPNVTDPCPYTMTNDFNGTASANGTYPVGTTLVTWTITGISGNISSCTQNVTVIDNQPPTITCPDDYEDEITNGDCDLIVDDMGYPVIWDNCPDPVLTWEMTGATTGMGSGYVNGESFNIGITTVRYIITDGAGNWNDCTFTVWVKSITVPAFDVECPADVTLSAATGSCDIYVDVPSPVIINPCKELYSIDNDSPYGNSDASGIYPVGVTTITWTIIDASGNIFPCTQVITITDDEDPTITCPSNVVDIITNGGCTLIPGTIGYPTFGDNCSGSTLTWEMTGATTGNGTGYVNGQVFNVGITTVTYTVHDAAGNTATCFFTVWIKNLTAPQFEAFCPENETADNTPGRCDANVTVTPPTISNPCNELYTMVHNSTYGVSSTDASGIYPVGTTTFTWTITDASGNVTLCPQSVTVVDVEDPTITCPLNAIDEITNGGCTMVPGTLGTPAYNDNCLVTTLTWQMTGATTGNSPGTGINFVNGQTFNVGITFVTYTASDAAGNSVSCTFQVWIKNLTAPQFSVTCPGNVTEYAGSSCELDVLVPGPGINNPCNEAYTISNNSIYQTSATNASGTYPVGTTSFIWTIVDASGNIITCPQSVTVIDNVPPDLDCPDNIEQYIINGGCDLSNVIIPPPDYSDNCGVLILQWETEGATVLSSPSTGINIFSGYTLNVGVTTVIYTAVDASGNTVTCSFTVWIKNLDDPPFTVTCPADVTVSAPANRCEADVTVTAPQIFNPCNEAFSIVPAGDISGTYNIGTTTITWIVTDASGNITTCNVNITVVDDTDPTLICPPSFSVNADYEQTYATDVLIPRPSVSDACGVDILTWVLSGATSASSPATGINWLDMYTLNVGVNTITYTATDIYSNVSTCFFTITVLSEPVIECPADISTTTDPGVCYANRDPGVPVLISGVQPIDWTWTVRNDAGDIIASGTCNDCPVGSLSVTPNPFPFPEGVNTVTWTAENISGMDQCTQTVTVVDEEPPTITTPTPPSFCVSVLMTAVYDGQPGWDADIVPEFPFLQPPFISSWRRPDWYIINGTTELDVIVTDNCCFDEADIIWTIQFEGNDPLQPDISGTGQPSDYGQIILWGSPLNVTLTHTITYIITDCNGNISLPVTMDIIIKPRPDLIKQP